MALARLKDRVRKVFPALKRKFELRNAVSGMGRYLQFALIVFVSTALLSYFFFRKGPMSLTVKLANVQFKDKLSLSFETESEVKSLSANDVVSKTGGKLEELFARPGEAVKKDQLLAVMDEARNRDRLKAALDGFKLASARLAELKRPKGHRRPETEDAEKRLHDQRLELLASKRALEESMIRSPADGNFWPGAVHLGDSVPKGAVIGSVDDSLMYQVPIHLSSKKSEEIPSPVKVSMTPVETEAGRGGSSPAPLEISAEVRYASAKTEKPGEDVNLELVFKGGEPLAHLYHQRVHVKVVLNEIKNAALVEPAAVITKDGESKIILLSPSGTLHWQRVTKAPKFKDRVVIRGANPKYFRAILPDPDKLDVLNQAITTNARPKVKG